MGTPIWGKREEGNEQGDEFSYLSTGKRRGSEGDDPSPLPLNQTFSLLKEKRSRGRRIAFPFFSCVWSLSKSSPKQAKLISPWIRILHYLYNVFSQGNTSLRCQPTLKLFHKVFAWAMRLCEPDWIHSVFSIKSLLYFVMDFCPVPVRKAVGLHGENQGYAVRKV